MVIGSISSSKRFKEVLIKDDSAQAGGDDDKQRKMKLEASWWFLRFISAKKQAIEDEGI